jgi:predicted hydrocarbon binding protein
MPPRPTNEARPPAREAFLRAEAAAGALFQPDAQRTALVPVDFLASLSIAVAKEFGASAHHVLYCAGFDWSLQAMVRLGQGLRQQAGAAANLDLWQMNAPFVLESWWAPLAATGWGACRFSRLTPQLVLAEIQDSAPALAAGRAAEPVCHLTAGLLAGALSFHERTERHAVEIACAALGAPACQFIVGASPQIDDVEAWQKQQLSADEIRRRLAA